MPLEDINTTPPKQAQQNARRGLDQNSLKTKGEKTWKKII